MANPVIPTLHIGLRNKITDPDSIVNYVLRHVIMNPGSITSLHADTEVSVRKIDGNRQEVTSALADDFGKAIQSILDRYQTDTNRFMVAVEVIDNNDGKSMTFKLSIKATWNNKVVAYDREFLVDDTKTFREMIMNANRVPEKEEIPTSGPTTTVY